MLPLNKIFITGCVVCPCGGTVISNSGKIMPGDDHCSTLLCWICNRQFRIEMAYALRKEGKVVILPKLDISEQGIILENKTDLATCFQGIVIIHYRRLDKSRISILYRNEVHLGVEFYQRYISNQTPENLLSILQDIDIIDFRRYSDSKKKN